MRARRPAYAAARDYRGQVNHVAIAEPADLAAVSLDALPGVG